MTPSGSQRNATEPKGAKIRLNHLAALGAHCFSADVDIEAGLVDVADCVVELA